MSTDTPPGTAWLPRGIATDGPGRPVWYQNGPDWCTGWTVSRPGGDGSVRVAGDPHAGTYNYGRHPAFLYLRIDLDEGRFAAVRWMRGQSGWVDALLAAARPPLSDEQDSSHPGLRSAMAINAVRAVDAYIMDGVANSHWISDDRLREVCSRLESANRRRQAAELLSVVG